MKSIFDVLEGELNLIKDYSKLYKLLMNEQYIKPNNDNDILDISYNLQEAFDIHIEEWKYQSTYTSLYEILKDLKLDKVTTKENVLQELLLLIELILNIQLFIESLNKYTIYKNKLNYNINLILNQIGYDYKQVDDKILLFNRNKPDGLITAIIVEDNDISKSIIEYMDFKKEKDIKIKKEILISLANYLEPKRPVLKSIDKMLEDNIFFIFNNINVRHNNKEGKYKNSYAATISDDEQLEVYDRLYNMILTAIRLINIYDEKDFYKDLKLKTQNKIVE